VNLLEHLFIHWLERGEGDESAARFALVSLEVFERETAHLKPAPLVFEPADLTQKDLEHAIVGRVWPNATEEELRWRTVQTWEAHLAENNAFFQAENGVVPSVQPTMTPDIRKDIRDALKLFDAHLLTPDKREEWKRNSKVRAAGVGIYLDPFCCGTSKDNNVKDGGKRYLEHWRPWKSQRGKGHPVERFAQLYFEARDVRS